MYFDSVYLIRSEGNHATLDLDRHDLKINTRYTVEIKPWKPKRSLPQNALFHALCGEIARITGMDSTLVKEGVKDLYGPKIPGIHGRLIPKPSHLCDKLEMADLIMGAEVELTEAGGDPRIIQNSLT
jgi:hypothetical protein